MTPEFARGFRASVPAGIGVLVYGLVFGVLAAEKGVWAPMLAVVIVAVFSGSAQFILVGVWGGGMQVMTESPGVPWILKALRAGWMPGPPPEAEPAAVRREGGGDVGGMRFMMRRPPQGLRRFRESF